MKHKKVQIEELLERIGDETQEDTMHRYELRRALLRSKHFDSARKTSRWDVLFTYTGPLVAGTMVVGAFAFLATTITPAETIIVDPQQPALIVVTATVPVADVALADSDAAIGAGFISDPEAPLVQLADFAETVQEHVVRFVPVTPQGVVMVR